MAPITIETLVNAPVTQVWDYWTSPEHIVHWNNASDDWHTPRATNDLRDGGSFVFRMEAKDGSVGFDLGGVYTKVEHLKRIEYTLGDDRKVRTTFDEMNGKTHITECFEPESENPEEMQRQGWQAILDHFKKYAEAKAGHEQVPA